MCSLPAVSHSSEPSQDMSICTSSFMPWCCALVKAPPHLVMQSFLNNISSLTVMGTVYPSSQLCFLVSKCVVLICVLSPLHQSFVGLGNRLQMISSAWRGLARFILIMFYQYLITIMTTASMAVLEQWAASSSQCMCKSFIWGDFSRVPYRYNLLPHLHSHS